jgi:uncharacterized protein (TIRG00374 family)
MKLKKLLIFLVKLSVSIGLLLFLFKKSDMGQFIERISHISPFFIIFGWVFYAICQWISAFRWQLFLKAKEEYVSLGKLFNFYMVGMFMNNFIPGGLGGDIIKTYRLHKLIKNGNLAIVSVFLERLTGFMGLTLLASLFIPFCMDRIESPEVLLAVSASLVFLLLILAFIWLPTMAKFNLWIGKFIFPKSLYEKLSQLYLSLHLFSHHRKTLFVTVLVSLILQFLFALYYFLAAEALGISVELIYFIVFLPAITLATMIPLSIGGLGPREAVMISLFHSIGVSSADVLSISLSVYAINLFLSLFGGLILVYDSIARPAWLK